MERGIAEGGGIYDVDYGCVGSVAGRTANLRHQNSKILLDSRLNQLGFFVSGVINPQTEDTENSQNRCNQFLIEKSTGGGQLSTK